jgi:hypothetical protein
MDSDFKLGAAKLQQMQTSTDRARGRRAGFIRGEELRVARGEGRNAAAVRMHAHALRATRVWCLKCTINAAIVVLEDHCATLHKSSVSPIGGASYPLTTQSMERAISMARIRLSPFPRCRGVILIVPRFVDGRFYCTPPGAPSMTQTPVGFVNHALEIYRNVCYDFFRK